jgi:competence protein ComEA
MIKKIFLVFILILIPFISAVCESGQININTASVIELDKLTGIGNATAWKIIWYREDFGSFKSIDELINVNGIADKKLASIKTQGLACVEGETNSKQEETQEEIFQEIEEIFEEPKEETVKQEDKITNIENNVISLSPQIIKSENDTESLSKTDYAKCGLGLFCVLLFGLFMFKTRKRKNEFR